MSPDRACQPIEWHIWKQCNANRSGGLTDRTAVRSANLKGSTNHHTQTHPSHQRKKQSTWRNQPIEPAGRSNGCSNGLSNQSNSPLDRTAVRSNGLLDPSTLFTFPRYSSLCYRTIQANLFSVLLSIHNQPLWVYSIPFCFQHFWVLHT